MKVGEILTEMRWGFDDHSKKEIDWNREAYAQTQVKAKDETRPVFMLKDKSGKVIRPGLTYDAAKALAERPDLIKKYGKLFVARG